MFLFLVLFVLFKHTLEQKSDSDCSIYSADICESLVNCRWSFFGCRLDEVSYNCNSTHQSQSTCDVSPNCTWRPGGNISVCARADKWIDYCYLNHGSNVYACTMDSNCEVEYVRGQAYCLNNTRPLESQCLSIDGDYCDSIFPCFWDTQCVIDTTSYDCSMSYSVESTCNADPYCAWTNGTQLSYCGSKDRWMDMCYMNYLFNITACSMDPKCEEILVSYDDEERGICFSIDRAHNHLCSRYPGDTCESVPECVWDVSSGLCVVDEISYNCQKNYTDHKTCDADLVCAWSVGGEHSFCARHDKWVDLCYIRHGQKADECRSDTDCEFILLGSNYQCLTITRPRYNLCGNFSDDVCDSHPACSWNENSSKCLIDEVAYSCMLNYTKEGPCFSDKKCEWIPTATSSVCSRNGKYVDKCLVEYGSNTTGCAADKSCEVVKVNDNDSFCYSKNRPQPTPPKPKASAMVVHINLWLTLLLMLIFIA